MKRVVKRVAKGVFNAPDGEVNGTPGFHARFSWGDAKQVMKTMLLSMTPPISVGYEYAATYIEACISERVKDRLTKEALTKGEVIQLYVLSYRHESATKTRRISRIRLQKAIDVIRSHAAECGHSYYSVWIDSLFPSGAVNPLTEWADRGLAPYSFCYVVVSPGHRGIEDDFTRAWIRCEHQLAFASRGILLHPFDPRPPWVSGRKKPITSFHVHIRGGCLEPRFALRALAIAIFYGLLRGTFVTYEEDLQKLKQWSKRMLTSEWPRAFRNLGEWSYNSLLPGPIAIETPVIEGRVDRMLTNLTNVNKWGTMKIHPGWDVIGPVQMIRHYGPPRNWSTGYELALALQGDMKLSQSEWFTGEQIAKLSERSSVFVVLCGPFYRGLVICPWGGGKPAFVLDVEIMSQRDGSTVVTGYSMILSSKIRRFRFAPCLEDLAGNLGVASVLGQDGRAKFLEDLTQLYYSKLGTGLRATKMYQTDCSRWIVR